MIRRFYGVYLADSNIATVLDLIRFLGEPDSLRFSHITLRGPYKNPMKRERFEAINSRADFDWRIELLRPTQFFSPSQCTVVIEVNLGSLLPIFYKPDFPDGIPHITIYDGVDSEFASKIHELISRYNWQNWLEVSRLRPIDRSAKLEGNLIGVFNKFCAYFSNFIGDPENIGSVALLDQSSRLGIMKVILEACVASTQLSNHSALDFSEHPGDAKRGADLFEARSPQSAAVPTIKKWSWMSLSSKLGKS